MKKLNNAELGALAQKIQSESIKLSRAESNLVNTKVYKEVNKLWAKFKKSSDYKVLVKYKITPNLSMIVKEIKEGGFVFNTNYSYNVGSLSTDAGTLYIHNKTFDVSYDDIKRELTLAQIEATDLDSLISKVKKSLNIK